MKKVYLTIGMVLLLAVAQLNAVEGKYGYGLKGQGNMHRSRLGSRAGNGIGIVLKSKERLGLDAEQVEQLTAIGNEVQGQFKANAEAVKAKRDALQELVKSGASEAMIRAAASEIGNAIGDQAVLRASTKAKVNEILTDDQKAELEELRKQQTERRKEQRGKGKRGTSQGTKGRSRPGKNARDPESAFTRIDTDGDGAISLEEFKTHMEQMKELRGERRSRGRRWTRPEAPTSESED